jgi:two-component system CheB/CheR fusion protein
VVQHVIETPTIYEREIQDEDGRWYAMRVRPYRTTENRIEGAVLQLVDVDELKRGVDRVKRARDYAEAIVNTVRSR